MYVSNTHKFGGMILYSFGTVEQELNFLLNIYGYLIYNSYYRLFLKFRKPYRQTYTVADI